jgi:hypothetical protein
VLESAARRTATARPRGEHGARRRSRRPPVRTDARRQDPERLLAERL